MALQSAAGRVAPPIAHNRGMPTLFAPIILRRTVRAFVPSLALVAAAPAFAAAAGFDGGQLSLLWIVPFAGILLSIALGPMIAPSFWHHHFGK